MNEMRLFRLMIPAAIAFVICACGPSVTQVRTFAAAAQSVSQDAQQCFSLIDESVVTRNMYNVALSTTQFPTDKTFQGFFDTASDQTKSGALKARIELLSRLGDYGAALQRLAEADVTSEVDAASTNLFGAVNDIQNTYTQISGKSGLISTQQMGAISTAVEALGSSLVESKRRKALRQIILNTDDAVQAAAKMIQDDLAPKPPAEAGSDFGEFVFQNLTNVDGTLRSAYNRDRAKPGSTFNGRLSQIIEIRSAYQKEATVKPLFAALAASAAALAQAHHELRIATSSKSFTSDQAAVAIAKLASNVRLVKSLYTQMRTSGG